jgi:hypothetical protein
MTDYTFTRSGLAEYRQWLGIVDELRESLRERYPTREAAVEAMEYGNFAARRDAIRVLGAMGDFEAVLHYALVERQSSWIPTLACDLLVQPPLEVLVSWVTKMKPSGDGSRLSEVVMMVLPKLSLAHCGDALIDFFLKHKPKLKTLSPENLKSLGSSALTPAARLLQPHAGLDTLRTYAQALEAGVPRKTCRPSSLEFMLGEENRTLDRASTSAVAAAVALRRLGEPVDTSRVADWLRQIEHLFSAEDLGRYPVSELVMELRWVLFDAGDERGLETLLSEKGLGVRHDVAMTLLSRGDDANFDRWRRSIPEKHPNLIHPPRQVHYWPLIDHLQSLGLGRMPLNSDGYLLSRAANVPPPHGWTWKSMPGEV